MSPQLFPADMLTDRSEQFLMAEVIREKLTLALRQEVPYGLQVSADCKHLEENPQEVEALTVMLECIVADKKLSEVAAELDRRGLPPRGTSSWTQVSVFEMLPRLIEVAPSILSTQEWSERREKVLRLVS